jgi:hypothetical protein
MNKCKFVVIIFLITYSLFSVFGTIFLIGWGGESRIKSTLMIFYKFPFDWTKLITENSLAFIPLNILFWTTLVFFLCFIIQWFARKLSGFFTKTQDLSN